MLELLGRKISLRRTVAADFPFIDEAELAPENAAFVGRWEPDERLAAMDNPDFLNLTIFDKGNTHAGFLILKGLENTDRCMAVYRMVVTEKGRGYGREALELAIRYAFVQMKAHRLAIDVVDDNDRAIALYKSAGFVVEGILRENMLYPERYKSLVLMSILEDEYVSCAYDAPLD